MAGKLVGLIVAGLSIPAVSFGAWKISSDDDFSLDTKSVKAEMDKKEKEARENCSQLGVGISGRSTESSSLPGGGFQERSVSCNVTRTTSSNSYSYSTTSRR